MKKLLRFSLAICAFVAFQQASAQRYLTEVFSDVSVTANETYGQNYSVLTGSPVLQNLVMDVYEPMGDTASVRPLIVLAHSGSFLPRYINQLAVGDKSDSATVEIANRFARMGYVVANISYRVGWNPQGTQDERTETIINAVFRAVQDAKSAVRFFRKDFETNNTFKIDTSRIAVGGQGSGGYVPLAYASLNKLTELQLTKFFNFTTNAFMVDTALVGDWDGFGGNPALNFENHVGYSSEAHVAFHIAGGIGDTSWIEAGEIPIISLHGVADAFTPFGPGIVTVPGTTLFVVDVSGGSDVIRIANDLGNNDVFLNPPFTDPITQAANAHNNALDGTWGNGGDEGLFPFTGAANGNGPWEWWDDATVTAGAMALGQDASMILANSYAGNPVYQMLGPVAGKARAMAYIDTIQGYIAPRLFRQLFTVGVDELDLDNSIVVYPNPIAGQGTVTVSANEGRQILAVEVFNMTGQLVFSEPNLKQNTYNFSQANLNKGIYFVNVHMEEGIATKKLIKQ